MFRRVMLTILSLTIIAGLQPGCNLFAPQLPSSNDGQTTGDTTGTDPLPADTLGINGAWLQETTGSSPAYCITIANEEVTVFDDACDGSTLNIISSRSSTYGATGIAIGIVVGASAESTEYTLYSFTLYPQANGSMTGLVRIQSNPAGTVTSEHITWIPQ